jgi:hypothetical protein
VGRGVGTVVHAASAANSSAITNRLGSSRSPYMAWIILEAFVALALGLFIVWWTMSGRRRHPPGQGEKSAEPEARDGNDRTRTP